MTARAILRFLIRCVVWHFDTGGESVSWLDRSHGPRGVVLLRRGGWHCPDTSLRTPDALASWNRRDGTKARRSALAYRGNHRRRCYGPGAASGRAQSYRCRHRIALADTRGRGNGAHGMVSFPRKFRPTYRPWHGVSAHGRRHPLVVRATHAIECRRATRNYRRMCRLGVGQQSHAQSLTFGSTADRGAEGPR